MTDELSPTVLRHADPAEVAERVAERLVDRLAGLQAEGRVPVVVLTGGTVAARVHEAVASSPIRDRVDWGRVEFWFGDERFVASDSPDRNYGQAVAAMLDALPVDPGRVHPMPASDGPYGEDVDAAAAAYAAELTSVASGDGPLFDVLMLGVGPDGHCASLFPGHAEVSDERPVLAVRDSPKPPPTRISLGMGMLGLSREVWFLATGVEKADAVAAALTGADVVAVPAAGPKGLERTLWFVDEAAAGRL